MLAEKANGWTTLRRRGAMLRRLNQTLAARDQM
jgi:hypothetical protein